MNYSKQDRCQDYLSDRAARTADWRYTQAQRFPHDKRNKKAAERLESFSAAALIPDAAWTELAPFYSETDYRWSDAVSTTNRDCEFRAFPETFPDYLQSLLSNLTKH